MKNILFVALMMSCLYSRSQSHDIAGGYETKSASSIFLLKLHPDGTFLFDSYNKGFQGLPAEPSMSGRGTWSIAHGIISFETDPEKDINHNYTLNFNDTQAKYTDGISEEPANADTAAKLEFIASGIFWINGIELKKRI